MSNDDRDESRAYSAAVVTFRRPESLIEVLQSLLTQTHLPTVVSVADNDPSESARAAVEDIAARSPVPVVYLAVGENLGPAGGWAAATSVAQERRDRGTWVAIFDDDDPLPSPLVMEVLAERAASLARSTQLGAVGLRGAVMDRRRARLRRVVGDDGDAAAVDYLAGNGAPLYAWEAIDAVGFFDPSLFFGFEDLDQGLRLRAAGWEVRVLSLPSLVEIADTAPTRVPWREYYKTRALVAICRRHFGTVTLAAFLTRSVVLGSVALGWRHRSIGLPMARVSGAIDGLRGRLGKRRYDPATNPPKSALPGG